MVNRARPWVSALLALVLPMAMTAARADNGGFVVRDEWASVDRLFMAVDPSSTTVSPIALEVIRRAKSKARIFISDGDKANQGKVVEHLLANGAIAKANEVTIIDNPSPSSWARDFSPLVRFDAKNGANLAAMAHTEDFDQKANLQRIAQTVELPNGGVPRITFPGHAAVDLYLDGGDWMTTDGGKTLITTTTLYEQYSDLANAATVKTLVDAVLKKAFGIEKVIALQPLVKDGGGYHLLNTHVDLQVRTLPDRKVIVASVAAGDVQAAVLDANAKTLKDAGYTVIRVPNAPQVPGRTDFRSYTNTLFVNGLVLMPSYGAQEADAAAKAQFDNALNGGAPGNAPRYVIEQIDSSVGIQFCGAVRCSAREVYTSPSRKKGPEASSVRNPWLSFDAASGELRFSNGLINFLGMADGMHSTPAFFDDPVRGAVLSVEGLVLSRSMSEADRYAFVGGRLHLSKDGVECLGAKIPVFSVYGTVPTDALNLWGALTDVTLGDCEADSAWMQAFVDEVLDSPSLLPDLFVESPVDLIVESNGFLNDIAPIELARMGIVGNGTPVDEPDMRTLTATCLLLLLAFQHVRLRRRRSAPTARSWWPRRGPTARSMAPQRFAADA